MANFTVTPEIITKISGDFKIQEKEVDALYKAYECKIAGKMGQHYLAHLIRTMEETLRKLPGYELFCIVDSPTSGEGRLLDMAGSQYFPQRLFVMYYDPRTDEKQLRNMLAHELGHLFLTEFFNAGAWDNKDIVERYSTLFGIFAILDKNDFYHNKTKPFKHDKLEDVLDDFILMHNRKLGKLNTSKK